jgi:Ca2+-binding EF-hand superfamily protein
VGLLGCYGLAQEAAQKAFRRLDRDGTDYLTTEKLVECYKEFLGDDPDAPGNWLMGPY